jgi:ABC-type proline/glycine betaine transport system permease subunit
MAQPVSTQPEMPAILPGRKLASAIVVGGAALGAVVVAGALGLWFHYGTTVFFEMITSGISACF